MFAKLDGDNSGTLDKNEVVGVLVNECDVEPNEAEAVIEQADKNGDGTLDKKEFEFMWNSMFGTGSSPSSLWVHVHFGGAWVLREYMCIEWVHAHWVSTRLLCQYTCIIWVMFTMWVQVNF